MLILHKSNLRSPLMDFTVKQLINMRSITPKVYAKYKNNFKKLKALRGGIKNFCCVRSDIFVH